MTPQANVSDWDMWFIRGILNDHNRRELQYMESLGIKIKSIEEIIDDLQMNNNDLRTGGIGKNISDLITVYNNL